MKENELKTTSVKGITLIALIITIIVMLILVGVTVSIAINGGLFANAKQAKTDTQNALNAENKLSEGKVNIDGSVYNSIDEYVSGATSKYIGPLGEALNVDDYGKIVTNFKSEGYPDLVWRVFFENKENVYLISETEDKKCPEQAFALSDLLGNYESGADVSEEGQNLMPLGKAAGLFDKTNTSDNVIATACMCGTDLWTDYKDSEGKAAWAMGGPTIELFVASYNATQGKEATVTVSSNGYGNCNGLSLLTTEMKNGIYILNNTEEYWLASPCSRGSLRKVMLGVGKDGSIMTSFTVDSEYYARPIVCIPQSNFSGFTLE